jgi:hypothetical protein
MSAKAATPGSEETGSSRAKFMTIPYLGLLVVVAVIAWALISGQKPTAVEIPGVLGVQFSGQKPSSAEVQKAQPAQQQRVAALEQQAQASATPAAPSDLNIAGTWAGNDGFEYSFGQFGNQVVFREISTFGVTATGSGVVNGSAVSLTFTALNGSTGRCELTGDGNNTLSGTCANDLAGTQAPITMSR